MKKGLKLDIDFSEDFTVNSTGTFQQGDFAIGGGGVTAAQQGNAADNGIRIVEQPAAAPAPAAAKKKSLSLDLSLEDAPSPAPVAPAPPPEKVVEAPASAASTAALDAATEGLTSIAKDLDGGIKFEDLDKEEQLGAGASGIVWQVKDRSTQKIYALKQIPLEADEAKRKQLIVELKTMHECRCDAIVLCHGLFYVESAFYIVLELMDAGSLFDILEKSPNKILPENIVAIIGRQVCVALQYLHEQRRLIHRDLKPPNILVNSRGQFKVADFGVSGVMSESKSVCASWVGTVTYMSPERIGGDKYGFRSDIWSLGLMLMECAIGRYPYINSSTPQSLSFWDLLDLIVDKPAPKLPHEGFSAEFRQFVTACLAKDPKKRPTAADCLEAPFFTKLNKEPTVDMAQWVKKVYEGTAGIVDGVKNLSVQ